MKDALVRYTPFGSEQELKLSPSIVRQYLVSGTGNVSDQEVTMFIQLCRFQGLNPYLREAYLIKYGSQPATIVTGKDAFTKRAEAHPEFRGMQAGVVVQANGELVYRPGSLVLDGEQVVGGWAKVWKKDREVPYETSVAFDEYVGRKSDGTVNRQWKEKPATMIRKVALVQALREAFPDSLGGMYDSSEMSHVDPAVLEEKDVSPPPDEQEKIAEKEPVEDAKVGTEPAIDEKAADAGFNDEKNLEIF